VVSVGLWHHLLAARAWRLGLACGSHAESFEAVISPTFLPAAGQWYSGPAFWFKFALNSVASAPQAR